MNSALHSVGREAAIVGEVLRDNGAIAYCGDLAHTEFYDHQHALVWRIITALVAAGEAADVVGVLDALKREHIEGIDPLWLDSLTKDVISAKAMKGHVARVRELATLRSMAAIIENPALSLSEKTEAIAALSHTVLSRFELVPVADLAHTQPPAPAYVWDHYLPVGVVTLLSAHGGVGKSMLALMVAVATALGLPQFGVATQRRKVGYYSGEDGGELLRYRLRWICDKLGVNPADLEDWLFVLDVTDDPVLFHEVTEGGTKRGTTTPAFTELRRFLVQHEIGLLIVDNASDTYDADEINRATPNSV